MTAKRVPGKTGLIRLRVGALSRVSTGPWGIQQPSIRIWFELSSVDVVFSRLRMEGFRLEANINELMD